MPPTPIHPEAEVLLLDVRAAARALSISVRTLYKLFAIGEIQPLKIGHSTRVSVAELRRYVADLGDSKAVRK